MLFKRHYTSITGFDILIIGPDSLPDAQTADVQNWLEKGGRILCLEQSGNHKVSFVPGMSLQFSGSMPFTDMIATEHPVLRGLNPWHFELWNGKRHKVDSYWDAQAKAIYTSHLTPMQDGVILSGASRGDGWMQNPRFGTVAGEVKAGKGVIFFSQVLAVQRLESDPVAAVYLRNVLNYVTSDSWNELPRK